MKRLIFVGGPTGCGKTSFVKSLENILKNVVEYRRVQGFYDLAKERGIQKENIYQMIESSDVDDYFVNKVLDSEILVSDIHYAIQMDRNAITGNDGSFDSEYVSTLSNDLINKLLNAEVEIYAVFLECSPEISFQRALKRHLDGKRELRNGTLEASVCETNAEKNMWLALCNKYREIKSVKLNSEVYSQDKLADILVKEMLYDKQMTLKK